MLTIGTFDGVHAGHRALVARARSIADMTVPSRVTALVFEPHPMTVLRPGSAPARLSSFPLRERLLVEAGADAVERLVPTPELLALEPAEFVRLLVQKHHPAAIVEGMDFRFGKGRSGDVITLDDLARQHGVRTDVISPVEVTLDDHTVIAASSTITRWLLGQGRVRDAALVLGRPYLMEGRVERGDRRGRDLGFPTANLSTDHLVPADGIYAARALLPDGRAFPAGVHVGPRDTFGDPRRVVEAHLIGAPLDRAGAIEGLAEYGWTIGLEFISWLRDPAPFGSAAALIDQMSIDCRRALAAVNAHPSPAHDAARCTAGQETIA